MGMGFQRQSLYNAPSVFENLVSQGQTTSGVFALKLASPGSELSIGGLNSDLYSGAPTYTPVIGKGQWRIEVSALNVGTTVIGSPTEAVMDSVRFEAT
jgi:cathepsin D